MILELALPWPPSMNHYWRIFKNRNILSKDGRLYKKAVSGVVGVAGARQGLTGRLSVKIKLYPPNKVRRDIDNSVKAILDSLQAAGVFEDDSQIDHLRVDRAEIVDGGAAVVIIAGDR